jgi:hypothetical protein
LNLSVGALKFDAASMIIKAAYILVDSAAAGVLQE